MSAGAALPTQHAALPCLLARWAGQPGWVLLDTGFAQASVFLDIWQAWRAHAKRPALLHYVGLLSLSEAAALGAGLQSKATANSAQAALCASLAAQCYGLGAGFHRLRLDAGRLSLTLCVGEMASSLAQLDLQADTLLAQTPEAGWDKWALKALARCCQRGTQLVFSDATLPPQALLREAGFQLDLAGPQGAQARYDPHWQPRSPRRSLPEPGRQAGRCAVVGAGIAGASVAQALALRGWQVDVYDSRASPAGGAAGLPVGLVVPHHSADDGARSRMSRAGTRLMLQHARELLHPGQDWQAGGVLELRIEESGLAEVEAEVLSHATPRQPPTGWASHSALNQTPGLWHPYAAWIKPARLVQRWLEQPGIRFHGSRPVHSLQHAQPDWLLRDAQGAELGRADLVVLANAHGCLELVQGLAADPQHRLAWIPQALEKLQALQTLQGTLSLGPCPAPAADAASVLPAFPVNGHGSFVSGVPGALGPQWFAGSTFESDPRLHADLGQEHARNLAKLQALLPAVAQLLAPQFASHQVQAWQGTRCISHDRLPLVGPLDAGAQPTLWLCAAMGARGLSFSALCAELLAAWLGHEPLPIESQLAKALSTRRLLRKKDQAQG